MSSGNSKLCGALTKLDTFKPLPGVQLVSARRFVLPMWGSKKLACERRIRW